MANGKKSLHSRLDHSIFLLYTLKLHTKGKIPRLLGKIPKSQVDPQNGKIPRSWEKSQAVVALIPVYIYSMDQGLLKKYFLSCLE